MANVELDQLALMVDGILLHLCRLRDSRGQGSPGVG
jgi:hypothetical protein